LGLQLDFARHPSTVLTDARQSWRLRPIFVNSGIAKRTISTKSSASSLAQFRQILFPGSRTPAPGIAGKVRKQWFPEGQPPLFSTVVAENESAT